MTEQCTRCDRLKAIICNLLEALQALVDECDAYDYAPASILIVDRAKAAIAKAREDG